MAVCTQAVCQTDTIAYPYRYYFPPLSDALDHINIYNIPDTCRLQSANCLTAEILNINTSSHLWNNNIYIGSVAEQEMEVIGISIPAPLGGHYGENLWNSGYAWPWSIDPYSFRLAIPMSGTVTDIWESPLLNLPEDLVENRLIKCFFNWCAPNRYVYGSFMEIMLDTAYHFNEGDTVYISFGRKRNPTDSTGKAEYWQEIYTYYETHGYSSQPAASNWHLPGLLYAGYIDGEWMQGTFHAQPLIWAIVRFPDDTCPAPQELRATAIGEGTEFLQFDTMGNHAAWEISYGPSGTAPDDGTVVQTTIPQAVIGNLDPTTCYVAYCRARCDFARSEWSPWSDSLVFTPSLAGIDDAARPQLSLAPNPAHGKVRIACSHAMQAVTLIAADGTTALTLHPDATEATLDLHALPAGTYTVVAATAAGTAVRRLVRQ